MGVTVSYSGPVFDGRAVAAVDQYTHHTEDKLSEDLIQRVRAHLAGVLRVNHGRYESYIHAEAEDGHRVVTDRWIVYGPWLEGVGSRNSPVTRFPGYHTFRIVGQEFQAVAPELAEAELPRYVEEMNA